MFAKVEITHIIFLIVAVIILMYNLFNVLITKAAFLDAQYKNNPLSYYGILKAIKSYLINFWLNKDPEQNKKISTILTYVLPVVFFYYVLYNGFCYLSTLTFDAYYNPSIALELLKKIVQNPYLLILSLSFLFIFRKRIFLSWLSLEKGKTVRVVILITAFILAWYYATYNYNFYFNQSHIFDRVLLIFLAILIYWRPLFAVLFVLLLYSIMWQFESLIGYSFAASPLLLTRVIIMFLAFWVYNIIFKRFEISVFLFLLCCLIGTHYFTPGFGKLNSEWIINDHINYLLGATYANGWLSFLSKSTISSCITFLDNFNMPLRVFTLIVECGVLFFFLHLKYLRFIIICTVVMHLGIFMYSGIFFWMWILLHLTILTLLLKKDLPIHNIFSKHFVITGFLLIGLGKFWAAAGGLSWHDSPLSYTYIIEAKTEEGTIITLPPNFFSSYDYQFAVSNFKFLNKNKRLPIAWGATDDKTSQFFNIERSEKEIFEYEKQAGNIHKKEVDTKVFNNFITEYIKNRNNNLEVNQELFKYIKAPALYWSFPYYSSFQINKKITTIKIKEVTGYYNRNDGYKTIRTEDILQLKIDL